jgi:hypothetical protein
MLSAQLIEELHQLSRTDKLRALQILVNDLAEEDTALLAEHQYEVWSPYDSAATTNALEDLIGEDN